MNHPQQHPAMRPDAPKSAAADPLVDDTVGQTSSREPSSNQDSSALPDSESASLAATLALHSADASASTRLPRRFGDYELLSEIARGGMGVVYKARQVTLQRMVALKMILAGELADKEHIRRFRIEAEAAAQLDHPGIVPVHEVGELNGQHFYSMGYVAGTSLSRRIAAGPLPPHEAAQLIRHVAEAVQYAHERGIIHRDLKPGNILLPSKIAAGDASSGERPLPVDAALPSSRHAPSSHFPLRPRVTDFGLAKRVQGDSGLTTTGQIMGTPSYMPPEQATGRQDLVGPVSDVYSLGATLYAALTGRPPFQAASPMETILMLLEKDCVSPRQLCPTTPLDLEVIVLKCLEKQPGRRYASARELADELDRFLTGRPLVARPVSSAEKLWRACRRHPLMASLISSVAMLLLLVAVVATVAAVRLDRMAGRERTANLSAQSSAREAKGKAEAARVALVRQYAAQGNRRAEMGDTLGAAAWFAEAFSLETEESPRSTQRLRMTLALRQSPAMVNLWPHQGSVSCVRFHESTGRAVSAGYDGRAQVWDLATGQAVGPVLRHEQAILHAEFSPDGATVATAGIDRTARVWLVGSGEPAFQPLKMDVPISSVIFDPNGHRILTISGNPADLSPPPDQLAIPPWEVDGHATAQLWDAGTGAAMGSPLISNDHVYAAAFAPRGELLAVTHGHRARIFRSDGARVAETDKLDGIAVSLEFSADGRRLAVASYSGSVQVFDGETGQAITPLALSEGIRVSLRPDGSQFAARGVREVASGKTVAAAQGAHCGDVLWTSDDARQLLLVDEAARVWSSHDQRWLSPPLWHGGGIRSCRFSSDGRHLLIGGDQHIVQCWDLAASARAYRRFDGLNCVSACYSPDGAWIAAGSADGCAWIWEAATGKRLVGPLPNSGPILGLAFRPDGKVLATGDASGRVRQWDSSTGAAQPVAFEHAAPVESLSYSGDGAAIVVRTMNAQLRSYGTVYVWNAAESRSCVQPVADDNCGPWAISPDGQWLAVSVIDKLGVQLFALPGGQATGPIFPHGYAISRVRFSADSGEFVVAGADGLARVWDLTESREVHAGIRHGGVIASTAVSPDGRWLALGNVDGVARIWRLADGQAASRPLPHSAGIIAAVFSPDSRLLATSSADQVWRLWDVATGEPVTASLPSGAGPASFQFSPDGRALLTTTLDHAPVIWDLSVDANSSDELPSRSRLMAGRRVGLQGDLEPLTPDNFSSLGRDLLGASQSKPPLQTDETALAWRDGEAAEASRHKRYRDEIQHLDFLLLHHPKNPGWLARRGGAHFQLGNRENASQDLRHAVAHGAEGFSLRIYLAHLASAARQGDMALEHATRALELAPSSSNGWLQRGHVLANEGRWSQATQDFEEAVKRSPDSVDGHRYWALAALRAGDQTTYQRACAASVERFQRSSDLRTSAIAAQLCLLAPDAVADYELPLQMARRAAGLAPHDPHVVFALAGLLMRTGRQEGAWQMLEPELSARGDRAPLSFLILATLIQARRQELSESRGWWKKAQVLRSAESDADQAVGINWWNTAELAPLWEEAQRLLADSDETDLREDRTPP